MVEGNRMLATLIDLLGELEINLSGFISDTNTNNLVANERSSLTNMKTVLDTMVKKTVAQKKSDEDIAVMNKRLCNKTDTIFETLISTDDFLMKTKQIFNRAPDMAILKRQLLTFQELLGDILYSTCQITNFNSKSPSGILVKDLLFVERCYLNIWDLTVLISSKYKTQTETQEGSGCCYGEKRIYKLQNVSRNLQKGVKEMSKVKLNIEHFLKVNLVETELFSQDSCPKVCYIF